MKVCCGQFWCVFNVAWVTILYKAIHAHYFRWGFLFILSFVSGRSSPHLGKGLIKLRGDGKVERESNISSLNKILSFSFLPCLSAINVFPKETSVPLVAGRGQMRTNTSVTYRKYNRRGRHCSSFTLPDHAGAVLFQIPVELFYERRLYLFVGKVTACLNIMCFLL